MKQGHVIQRADYARRLGRVGFLAVALHVSLLAPDALASDHVVAIDVSGSMRWNEAGSPIKPGSAETMRIDIVRPPLMRYLSLLPDDSRVFLLAFNDGIVAQDEFVLKRAGDRDRMLAWVKALNPPRDSRTHLWYTLRKALQKAHEYGAQAPGEWVSVRIITDGEDDHPGSELTLTKVLNEFPEIERKALRPDLVLLGSLKTEFLVPIQQEQARGRINLIPRETMEDPFSPVIKTTPDPVIARRPTTIADDSKSAFATYRWFIDEQPVSTDPRFDHTFPEPGQVQVRVEAERRDGSRDATTRTISVLPVPVAAAFYVPSGLVAGEPAIFIGRAKGDVATYSWFVGDSRVCDSEDCKHTFAEPGEYRIRLVVSDAAGNSAESGQNVTVIAPPPIAAAPVAGFKIVGAAFKAGDPIQFMDDSRGLIDRYSWSFAGAGSSSEKNPVFAFPEPGEKKIELAVAGPGGSATSAQTITVAPRFVAPVVSATAEPRSGTVPFAVRFEASVEGDYDSLLWDFGDGHTSRETSPSHEYTTAGSYRPTLRARHSTSGLEGVFTGDLTITAKAPLPAWLWQALLGALILGALGAGYAYYVRRNPKVSGLLIWEHEGAAGEVALSGRRYPLERLGIPGWNPAAGYFIRNSGGNVTISAKGRGDIPLLLNERVSVDGAAFTYKGFD